MRFCFSKKNQLSSWKAPISHFHLFENSLCAFSNEDMNLNWLVNYASDVKFFFFYFAIFFKAKDTYRVILIKLIALNTIY